MKVQQDENKHSWRIGHLPRGRCVYPLTQSMSLEWPRVIMLRTDGPFKLNQTILIDFSLKAIDAVELKGSGFRD